MTADNTPSADSDTLAEFARIVYGQMNVEPRRMNVAIELAKQHMTEINRALEEQGLRSAETESAPERS